MIEAAAIIQKPVLSITSSCIIGRVKDVYFDENCKKAVYFCIALIDGHTALLPFSEVQNFSDALVVVDSVQLVPESDVDITSLRSGMLSMPIYSPTGVSKGKVQDIILTSTGRVVKLRTESDEFFPSAISGIGDVILQKSVVKNRPKTRKIKLPRPEEDYPVYALDSQQNKSVIEQSATPAVENSAVPTVAHISENPKAETSISVTYNSAITNSESPKPESQHTAVYVAPAEKTSSINIDDAAVVQPKPAVALSADNREPVLSNGAFNILLDGSSAFSYDEDAHTPTRVICDYEFLLGRKLGADLLTYTGDLIATQGTVVTDLVVEKARRAGKLVELTLNSVKQRKQK